MTEYPNLNVAERVEVTALVDNYIDIFVTQKTPIDVRPPFTLDRPLLAEHGFACLVRVFARGKEHTILLDTGMSGGCLLHNARQLGLPLDAAEALVLSHGHFDHTGGLLSYYGQTERQVPLITHPDAFLRRRLNSPVWGPVDLPVIDAVTLKNAGADVLLHKCPSALAAGHLLVTGEIERTTAFEKGFPGMVAWDGEQWLPDQLLDDQAIVINIRNKGLLVISACAHAGIINTVEYAKKITGVDQIHAVLGGFHLTGPAFAPIILPTVKAMKAIDPDYIVPMHCTGWDAINQFSQKMPEKFILNTVGTTYVF